MLKSSELLEVTNEQDEVIGFEPRSVIHALGLLHREIHIWFVTPRGEIIFQHRAKTKDTYPDKLDATVGGHVEPGMSYVETAIKECEEETGLKLSPEQLIPLVKLRKKTVDKATGAINNTFRFQYAFVFKGNVGDLKVELGKVEGFETWAIDHLLKLTDGQKSIFIPMIFDEDTLILFDKMKMLVKK